MDRRLRQALARGESLVHHRDLPGAQGVREMILVVREPDGSVSVRCEQYRAGNWDDDLASRQERFADLDSALAWVQRERGVEAAALQIAAHPARHRWES